MSVERINPAGLNTPPSYSHIAVARGSRQIFFAGQVPMDENSQVVAVGDLHAQTVATMRNLKIAMDAVGVRWEDITRRTIFTTQPFERVALAAAIKEVAGDSPLPPQTIVGVSGLALPELLVEIECTAVVDD